MYKNFIHSGLNLLWLSSIVLLLDRFSKNWALLHLSFNRPVNVLPILDFNLSFNTGAAFSFLNSANGWQNYFLGGLAVCISIGLICWLAQSSRQERWLNSAVCLILAGALGNVWDRILYSHVIDFISFHWGNWYFAIFNLADSAVCVGSFMLIVAWMWQARSDFTR